MYLNYYCYYCYRCYIYYSSQSKLNYTNNDDCGTVAADQYTSVLTSMLWILRTCRVLEPRVCMLSDVLALYSVQALRSTCTCTVYIFSCSLWPQFGTAFHHLLLILVPLQDAEAL